MFDKTHISVRLKEIEINEINENSEVFENQF